MGLKERLADPNSPERRPRRAAYALPTLFTAANIFLGYIAILRSFRGGLLAATGDPGAYEHFRVAAQAIGAAVFSDGLDGLIARMTNTTSDFGREMDSLADVISFGLAPAVLSYAWGIQFISVPDAGVMREFHNAGYFISFLFLLCGAVRLARFNVQKNPVPKNPGRPNRKYFVGMPIPAAAAMVASIVFAANGEPVTWWPLCLTFLALLLLLGFLMVSTWRYYSFKGISFSKPYTPLLLILLGAFIFGLWNYAQLMLLAMSAAYVASGIAIRLGGIVKRRLRHAHTAPAPESQIG